MYLRIRVVLGNLAAGRAVVVTVLGRPDLLRTSSGFTCEGGNPDDNGRNDGSADQQQHEVSAGRGGFLPVTLLEFLAAPAVAEVVTSWLAHNREL